MHAMCLLQLRNNILATRLAQVQRRCEHFSILSSDGIQRARMTCRDCLRPRCTLMPKPITRQDDGRATPPAISPSCCHLSVLMDERLLLQLDEHEAKLGKVLVPRNPFSLLETVAFQALEFGCHMAVREGCGDTETTKGPNQMLLQQLRRNKRACCSQRFWKALTKCVTT